MAEPQDSPVKIMCPKCGELFALPAEVLGEDGDMVTAKLDRAGVYGHMAECTGMLSEPKAMPQREVPEVDLSGRVHRFLTTGSFVSKAGSRACTMCGTTGAMCLQVLEGKARRSCCTLCADGNTHPAPGEAQGSCAQWAENQAAKS